MVRKTFIFFTLLSAYLLLLGHDLIPHHHHDDHATAERHSHDDARDADDDHEELPELFSYFVHAPYKAPAAGIVIPSAEKQAAAQTADLLPDAIQFHILKTIPVSHHPPNDEPCHSLLLSSSLPLRAPPAC
jgi:hypothetical protein